MHFIFYDKEHGRYIVQNKFRATDSNGGPGFQTDVNGPGFKLADVNYL